MLLCPDTEANRVYINKRRPQNGFRHYLERKVISMNDQIRLIALRISDMREIRGISQEEMARKMDMTEQEYAQVKKELERRLRPTILTQQ